MPTQTQELYAELIAQTQRFFLSEYELTQWKFVEAETCHFFRDYVQKHSSKPIPVKAPPPKPTPPTPVAKPVALKPPPPKPKPKPKPAPAKKEPKQSKPQPKGFELQDSTQKASADFSGFSDIVGTTLPELNPSDAIAKQKKPTTHFATPPDTLLLTFGEPPLHHQFLRHVAKAIEICYGSVGMIPAASVEAENGWAELLKAPNLRLIIATDIGLQSIPGIQKHIKESTKEGQAYLGNTPLLRLSNISSTLKDPKLKPALWRAINQLIRR